MEPERNRYENEWENPYSGYYGTRAPKKPKGGTGWLVFFIILLVLTLALSMFAGKYAIRVENGDGRLSFSVVRREMAEAPSASEADPEALPVPDLPKEELLEPAPEQTPEQPFNEATLEISATRHETAETLPSEEGVLTLQQIYRKMIPSVASIICVSPQGTSTGTGIVMSSDGYIITNHHVIENGESLTVLLH